jgi:hypothetical protein
MDHPESISIIMMLALSVLLGVIILICWCRDLWQQRAAIRWATQPLVDSADKGDGPESVQQGLRDADMDLAAATDQVISPSLRQCELAVQDLIAIGSAEEKPGQKDRPLVDYADKGDGPESVQHGLRDADMDLAALRLSSGGWRTFPSTDELKTYVDVLAGGRAAAVKCTSPGLGPRDSRWRDWHPRHPCGVALPEAGTNPSGAEWPGQARHAAKHPRRRRCSAQLARPIWRVRAIRVHASARAIRGRASARAINVHTSAGAAGGLDC